MNGHLTPHELDSLLETARDAVRLAVLDHRSLRPSLSAQPAALLEPGAVFVTLLRDGRLRGCIGTLSAIEPLVIAVAEHARAAALKDPRFLPVTPEELDHLDVEVSVLSTPEQFDVADYEHLVDSLRPGVDGLIVRTNTHSATLLPSVWASLPTPSAFVEALWLKAGLTPGYWPRDLSLARYTAQHAPPD